MFQQARFERIRRAILSPLREAGARLRRLAHARDGMAAIELALILPTMVFMYLGATEITNMVNTKHKMGLVSRAVADLAGRATSMNATDAGSILNAAKAVMVPFNAATMKVVVSSVVVTQTRDSKGEVVSATGSVAWSCARGGDALAKGVGVPVPEAFKTASSFIWTTVDMSYAPLFGSSMLQLFTGRATAPLEEKVAWPVRDTDQVRWDNYNGCS